MNVTHDDLLQGLEERIRGLVESGDYRLSNLVDMLLKGAIASRTSDVHIEPTKRGVRVRFRIDGVFHDAVQLPLEMHDQVVSRIKVLADLISHRREIVQEGRITVSVRERDQDMRVSIIPTALGEKVVLRMFTSAKPTFELSRLGYSEEMVNRIAALLFDLKGMIILTGPSGSGKTTTLYSLLLEVAREMDEYASLVTIEDPVEYEFGLFAQMEVNRKIDLDFAAGLKAILRQDPEVIMVGEIRDQETAEVALRAGLTGHLVLSTVHSGEACETVTRLLNMGLEPFIVASAVTGVIAQRLVRIICPACREEYTPEQTKLEFVRKILGDRDDMHFYRGSGCAACNRTGYVGRVPVAELLEVDEGVRTLILDKAQTSTLRRFARGRGFKTLLEDGLEKVIAGITTIQEVFRVVSLREAGL